MITLLIVDDEAKIRTVIREHAEVEGYQVLEAENGSRAIELCEEHGVDLIVMDVMMPGIDGFTALKTIRKKRDIPALVLSARGEEYDKLYGFEIGVDDYVVKPFSPKELMARLGVIATRRSLHGGAGAPADRLCFGGLALDIGGRAVTVDGQKLELTPKDLDLLFFLARHKNIVFTREQLLEKIWGIDFEGDSRTVDTHIKQLRRLLGAYRERIVTSRGAGYKFEAD